MLKSIHNVLIVSKLFCCFIVMVSLFSCGIVSRDISCFKTLKSDTTISKYVATNLESKIQQSDVLSIIISSLNRELDNQFNVTFPSGSHNGTTAQEPGYTIDENGCINIHYLGLVKVVGLTRSELKEKLQKDLAPFLKEPIVTVRYLNRKITIIGDVARPQVIYMPDEQISLIDAIVMSGDFNETASTDNIMLIRDSTDTKNIRHVNLHNHSVFSSPYYYLKSNDILYVSKDYKKIVKEDRKKDVQTNLSLLLSFTSLVVLIISLIRK